MISPSSLIQALALAMILAPVLANPIDQLEPRAACSADNCLRAVRASAFPTRLGTQDCSSYFITTITPALSTITSTASFSITSIVIQDVTYTTALPVTTTATIEATETDTAREITTVSTFTIPINVKRQVTAIPSLIPTYASAYSGSIRYSSACSCIGVTATTITAAMPLITTTISTTVPATTSTTLVTVLTEVTTIVAATTSFTTTDATSTTTTIISATATVEPHCPQGRNAYCCYLISGGTECLAVADVTDCNTGGSPYCCAAPGSGLSGCVLF